MNRKHLYTLVSFVIIALLLGTAYRIGQARGLPDPQSAINSGFTYQGQLNKDGNPYTGTCELTFVLWDAASNGNTVGTSQSKTGVSVVNGIFSVQLNEAGQFGASAFNGSQRWLEIDAKCGSDTNPTSLGRQLLTTTPFASYALTAGSVSGVVPIANGGTGSATQNFVDLTNNQTIAGTKTFSSPPNFTATSYQPFYVSSTYDVANLNADYLDGQHSTAFQKHYQNVKVVAKSGGDYTTISAALNSITDASSTNPYLIWVAPGSYFDAFTMKPYVDIQGAGEDVTKITSLGFSSLTSGTVIGANNATLSYLTVENAGNNTYAVAISNHLTSPRLLHLTVNASGGNSQNYAVYNDNSDPVMTLLNLVVQGTVGTDSYAVYNNVSAPVMTQLTLNVSSVSGSSSIGIYNALVYGKIPLINQINITASGSFYNYGIYTEASPGLTASPAEVNQPEVGQPTGTMNEVTVNVSGGAGGNYGIYCTTRIDCNITRVNVVVSGAASFNLGIAVKDTYNTRIQDARIEANGTNSRGLYNESTGVSSIATIIHSFIYGTSAALYNYGFAAYTSVGTSQVYGPVVISGSGVISCVGAYDSSFAPLDSMCQ